MWTSQEMSLTTDYSVLPDESKATKKACFNLLKAFSELLVSTMWQQATCQIGRSISVVKTGQEVAAKFREDVCYRATQFNVLLQGEKA